MKTVSNRAIALGCDPEFFFRMGGKIIEAEKILPEEGLSYTKLHESSEFGLSSVVSSPNGGKVTIDGVQAEINPRAHKSVAGLASEMGSCIKHLSQNAEIGGYALDFSQIVHLDDSDLSKLSEKSVKFGCSASKNINIVGDSIITVDPKKYNYRSAGGHVHIGSLEQFDAVYEALRQPERVVRLLDILLGNTCVMIDRSEGNIERRKVYGKAGEFRTPPHGLEYRTLSNFWMRNYQLMSFVFEMSRLCVNLVADNLDKRFVMLSDMDDIQKAINNNDAKLAKKNFDKIKDALVKVVGGSSEYPITKDTLSAFETFVSKSVDHWFDKDATEYWSSFDPLRDHKDNFRNFLLTKVQKNG